MADRAVAMAEAGCKAVCVLGVDFMSENVRAILDNAGHTDVAVYRMSADAIGCTLAEAAESPAYLHWLDGAAEEGNGVHVIYINTSLRTKAESNARVPTITCTSSNVVKTVLQAFAQVRPAATTLAAPALCGNVAYSCTCCARQRCKLVAELSQPIEQPPPVPHTSWLPPEAPVSCAHAHVATKSECCKYRQGRPASRADAVCAVCAGTGCARVVWAGHVHGAELAGAVCVACGHAG